MVLFVNVQSHDRHFLFKVLTLKIGTKQVGNEDHTNKTHIFHLLYFLLFYSEAWLDNLFLFTSQEYEEC